MLCSALLRAYRTFSDYNHYTLAKKIFNYIKFNITKNITLHHHNYLGDLVGQSAFLGDYAALIRVILECLIIIHSFTCDKKYSSVVDGCIKVRWKNTQKKPVLLISFVHLANLLINSHYMIVLKGDDKKYFEIIQYLSKNLVFNTPESIENSFALNKKNLVYGNKLLQNKTTVYICSKSACYKPINDFKKLKKKLKELPFL